MLLKIKKCYKIGCLCHIILIKLCSVLTTIRLTSIDHTHTPFPYYTVFLLVFSNIGYCFASAGEAQSIHISNYNVSSLDSQSTYYQSVPIKSISLSHPISPPSSNNPNTIIQKYAISDLSRDLQFQLKSIEDNDLLIKTIQNAFDSLEQALSSHDHNDTRIFNQIASKIEVKLSTAIRIVSETSQKIVSTLTESHNQINKLLLDAIVLPCINVPIIKHTERSTSNTRSENQIDDNENIKLNSSNGLIGGIDKEKTIEILNFLKNAAHLHQRDDKNFTINRRLMEILKNIDLSLTHVPNFRDAFFIPSHSYLSNSNCRNNPLNDHHRFVSSHTHNTFN